MKETLGSAQVQVHVAGDVLCSALPRAAFSTVQYNYK